MKELAEARPCFALTDFESTGSETPFSHHVCKKFSQTLKMEKVL